MMKRCWTLKWLGSLILVVSITAHSVIILPEGVDWTKQPNWLEDVEVQENVPSFDPDPLEEPPVEKEPLIRIRLRPPDEIPTGIVTLDDVAEIDCSDPTLYDEAAAIDLGSSPEPGESLYVFPRRVESALRSMGLHQGDFEIEGPERVRLQGESQMVSLERIEGAINAGLLARALEGPGGEIEAYLLRKPTPFHLPPGDLEIETLDLDRPGGGIRQIQLAFIVDGRKAETRTYSVRVNHKTHGLVAKRPLEPGDVVTEKDLTEGLINLENHNIDTDLVFDPESLLGMKVVRSIAPGDPITRGDVEHEPLKFRGDRVTLVQRVGKVQTTAPGELLEDAIKIGQSIRVKKSNSRKTFIGRLVSPWEVEVR